MGKKGYKKKKQITSWYGVVSIMKTVMKFSAIVFKIDKDYSKKALHMFGMGFALPLQKKECSD